MSNELVRCPKCGEIGHLFEKTSVASLIGKHTVAHVLHTDGIRRTCALRLSDLKSIAFKTPRHSLNG